MTHYRLTLTRGRKPAVVIEESHRDLPTLPRGWATIMRHDENVSAHLRACMWDDDECPPYGALRRHPTVPSTPGDETLSLPSLFRLKHKVHP